MELFTATGKLKKYFLTTGDVRCVHHWWHVTHRYDIQVLATHASTWVHDILHCCNDPRPQSQRSNVAMVGRTSTFHHFDVCAKETLVLVQKAYGNEVLNRSNVLRGVFTISRRKGISTSWREGWPSKIDCNLRKHCSCCWFIQNRPRIVSRMKTESLNILKTVVLQILKEDFCSWEFFLLHDNAPAHRAARVRQFLTPKNVTTLYYSPHFPHLSPPHYFLFPKLKMKLKGLHFAMLLRSKEP
jgi:hypothetical protein